MRIIDGAEFDAYWKNAAARNEDAAVESAVRKIIADVRSGGDAAVRRYAARFDKSSPERFEVPLS
ncbi:MAG: histidinol dehydrogenase, partial [Spirochaetaceae bacterium]|nr:histidinol dehydrogenase [Spirochaetaceae bacterium]